MHFAGSFDYGTEDIPIDDVDDIDEPKEVDASETENEQIQNLFIGNPAAMKVQPEECIVRNPKE